jgi:hypothetical protein
MKMDSHPREPLQTASRWFSPNLKVRENIEVDKPSLFMGSKRNIHP